jgi:hypothetical protein
MRRSLILALVALPLAGCGAAAKPIADPGGLCTGHGGIASDETYGGAPGGMTGFTIRCHDGQTIIGDGPPRYPTSRPR